MGRDARPVGLVAPREVIDAEGAWFDGSLRAYEKHITGRGRPGGRCPKCGDLAGTSGYCFDCGG